MGVDITIRMHFLAGIQNLLRPSRGAFYIMKNGYSICFNEWALDKSIKSELGMLLIISGLTAESGYCYASNEYFADKFQIDEVSVSRKIKKLKDNGYIEVRYERRGNEIVKREIRLAKMLTDDLQKDQPTVNKNVKENNTSNNNTSNNKKIYKKVSEELECEFEEFRKSYPGSKRGSETEMSRLKKHKDWKEVIPILSESLKREIEHKSNCKKHGEFVPPWKNLSTWINQRCWEMEFPEVGNLTDEEKLVLYRKIGFSEFKKRYNHREALRIDYLLDGCIL